MLHRSIAKLTADTRAGNLPVKCVKQLVDLAKSCVAEYDDRVSSMLSVFRSLRHIKIDYCYCPEPSDLESGLQQRLTTLIAQTETLNLAKDVVIASTSQSKRKCLVCYDDDLLVTDGFECTNNRHFVCQKIGCFERITIDQCVSKASFSSNGYKILCTVPNCKEVIEDHIVATMLVRMGCKHC